MCTERKGGKPLCSSSALMLSTPSQHLFDYPLWLCQLDEVDFETISLAAETIVSIHQALANDDLSIISEWLAGQGEKPIQIWAHYPEDDCRDPNSGAMVYYHAHDPVDWERDEHGHFHLFARPSAGQDFCHITAVSMNAYGIPTGLFATNGWVTDETMLPATEVLRILDENWQIHRTRPSWLVLQWLDALLTLTYPLIQDLLLRRDQVIGWTQQGQSSTGILDDRNTHILSELPLDWPGILEAVQSEAQARIDKGQFRAEAMC